MKGHRKTAFGLVALSMLLLGLGLSISFPAAGIVLYASYVAGVVGISGLVIAGNVGAKFAGKPPEDKQP
jgi:phosphatidylglycerophosphate synthase